VASQCASKNVSTFPVAAFAPELMLQQHINFKASTIKQLVSKIREISKALKGLLATHTPL